MCYTHSSPAIAFTLFSRLDTYMNHLEAIRELDSLSDEEPLCEGHMLHI